MAEQRPSYEELAARVAELEAAAQETRWHLDRLAALQDPLEKMLVGIWEQMRAKGLGDNWGRYLIRDGSLAVMLHAGPLRPDFDPGQHHKMRTFLEQNPIPLDSLSLTGAAFLANSPVAIADIQGDDGAT